MLSRAPEKYMFIFRWFLVLVWATIIILLIDDPITVKYTEPTNQSSPFHINLNNPVEVQGVILPNQPYSLTNRIFWTMIVPLVPFIILLLGHEFWRRICPLSALMQLPRLFKFQRRQRIVNETTGNVFRKTPVILADSWIAKNYWYIQFSFLWAGVTGRLMFFNSDQNGLLFLFLITILSAIVTGFMFDGKTWCNYICPLSPVQKFYSGTGGLLESKAHLSQLAVTQSMCRDRDDTSTCVTCKVNCPDSDLERNYWSEIHINGKRFFYFGFFGLVLGFYAYYYLYSGNWDYYFSGAWTHESSQLDQLLNPGFYLNGSVIHIPKVVAAPLTTATFVIVMYFIGCLFELIYSRYKESRGNPLPKETLSHHSYCITVFLTFNTFYIFGGRPNLMLLTPSFLFVIDFMIVSFSTIWLVNSLGKSHVRYEKESISYNLRKQLYKCSTELVKVLDKRSICDLDAGEIYLLGNIVPKLNENAGHTLYHNTLKEAYEHGDLGDNKGRAILERLRERLGINDDEHREMLNEIKQKKGIITV